MFLHRECEPPQGMQDSRRQVSTQSAASITTGFWREQSYTYLPLCCDLNFSLNNTCDPRVENTYSVLWRYGRP